MRDRTHVHVTSRAISVVLTRGRRDSGSLRKSAGADQSRGDRRGTVLIQRRSPGRAQQHLKKLDRILLVRGIVHQCDAPCDVGARNRDGARTPGSPESRQNHDRVLPVISILRGVRHVDLVGQIHVAVIRICRCRRAGIVFIGELKIELLAERGSDLTRNHHVLEHVVVEVRHLVILLRQLEDHGSPVSAGIEKRIPASDRDSGHGQDLVPFRSRSSAGRARRWEAISSRPDRLPNMPAPSCRGRTRY